MNQQANRNNLFISSIVFLALLILLGSPELHAEDSKINFNLGGDNVPEIDTTSGKIVGSHDTTPWGNVYKYYSVPYAEPPTDSKRFKLSEPLLGQDSSVHSKQSPAIHHHSNPPPACMQNKHLPEFSHPSLPQGGQRVSEDCLKLNVFKPADLKPAERISMFIWVPGDGYDFADTIQYDGSALAAKERIIVITVNYRVGVFGFASMGNSTLYGNAGLSDIASAIKFMAHNAQAFSGDSESITVGGRFSGAMAISTLVTSKLFYWDEMKAKPIANRVILHDGAATSEYTVDPNPSESFQKLAGITDCYTGDGEHTLACLQRVDEFKLLEKSKRVAYSWRPVIDGVNLKKIPVDAIEFGDFSSKIAFLIGTNSGSGSICYIVEKFLGSSFEKNFMNDDLTEEGFLSLAGRNLQEFYKIDEHLLSSMVSHEYFYGRNMSGLQSWRDAYFQFCSAMYTKNPAELYARYTSRWNSVVFRLEFDFKPSTSIYPPYFTGALGEEIILLFPTIKTQLTGEDSKTSDLLLESWANFIKTGDPSSSHTKWEHFDEIKKPLVAFTQNGVVVSTTNVLDPDVHFWRTVFMPVTKKLLDRKGRNLAVCPANPVVKQSSGGLAYLGVIFIMVISAVGLALIVHLIRNWQKPYIWKFG